MQDALKKKNEEILLKYESQAFAASREKFDSSDEETEKPNSRTNKVVKTIGTDRVSESGCGKNGQDKENPKDQNAHLEEELQKRSKEIEKLRKTILQLENQRNPSQLSTVTTGLLSHDLLCFQTKRYDF